MLTISSLDNGHHYKVVGIACAGLKVFDIAIGHGDVRDVKSNDVFAELSNRNKAVIMVCANGRSQSYIW